MNPHQQSLSYWAKRFAEVLNEDVPTDASKIRRVYTPEDFIETARSVIREHYEKTRNERNHRDSPVLGPHEGDTVASLRKVG